MRMEYKLGTVLGALAVLIAAWYFFSREQQPEVRVGGDPVANTPTQLAVGGTSEAIAPTNVSARPISIQPPTRIESLTADPEPIELVIESSAASEADRIARGPGETRPSEAAERDEVNPRLSLSDSSRLARANSRMVIPLPAAAAVTEPPSETANTPLITRSVAPNAARNVPGRTNVRSPVRRAPADTTIAVNVARSTPQRPESPTLLGARRARPAAADPVAVPDGPAVRRASVPAPDRAPDEPIVYTIRPKDSLAILSEIYYGSQRFVGAIVRANPKITDPNRIMVGQEITLPPKSLIVSAMAESTSASNRPASRSTPPAPTVSDAASETYRVQPGDTFYELAKSRYGSATRWRDLFALNRDRVGGRAEDLRAGQEILLPQTLPTAESLSRASQ